MREQLEQRAPLTMGEWRAKSSSLKLGSSRQLLRLLSARRHMAFCLNGR